MDTKRDQEAGATAPGSGCSSGPEDSGSQACGRQGRRLRPRCSEAGESGGNVEEDQVAGASLVSGPSSVVSCGIFGPGSRRNREQLTTDHGPPAIGYRPQTTDHGP